MTEEANVVQGGLDGRKGALGRPWLRALLDGAKHKMLKPILALVVGMNCTILNAGISLSPTSQAFGSSGGTGSFKVSYTGGLSFQTPQTSASWLSVKGTQLSTGSNSGTITVSYSVAANNSSSSRSGTIYGTVSGTSFTFTVNQAAGSSSSTTYTIRFNRNDGSGATASRTFTYNVKTRLPALKNGLGWSRTGYTFKGWATSIANANAGKIWKEDWAYVQTPVAPGNTLNVYAVWEFGTYTIRFNRNDGSGATASRTFTYNVKTRLPALKNGLGWSRTGYTFKGWATSIANANAGKIWKEDWAYVQTPVACGETLNVYAIWNSNGGDSDSLDFYATVGADAGQYYYALSGTGSLSYTSFKSSATWLTSAGTKSSTNSGEWTLNVYYNTASNSSASSRTGTLTGTIFGKTVRIHITQSGR